MFTTVQSECPCHSACRSAMAAAYLVVRNRQRRRVQVAPREYLIRGDPLENKTDSELIKKYRMDRAGIQYLCEELLMI